MKTIDLIVGAVLIVLASLALASQLFTSTKLERLFGPALFLSAAIAVLVLLGLSTRDNDVSIQETVQFGPEQARPGSLHNYPLHLGHEGIVRVLLADLQVDEGSSTTIWTPHLDVKVCAHAFDPGCSGHSLPLGGSFSSSLPRGDAVLTVMNKVGSAAITFRVTAIYPK